MVELLELKQEVYPVLSFFEDAVLVRGPLWVQQPWLFRRVVRRRLQKSWPASAPGCSNHTGGRMLLHHVYVQALTDEADDH